MTGYKQAYRDYRDLTSTFREDQVALDRSLESICTQLQHHLKGEKIGLVVGTDHCIFFRKLAEKIGDGARFVTVNSTDFQVVNGEKVLQVHAIADECRQVHSLRRVIRSKVKEKQIVPVVVAIAASPHIRAFKGVPVISLNRG